MCGNDSRLRADTIKYGQFGTQNNPGTGAGGSNPNPAAGIFGLLLGMAAKAQRNKLGREPTSKELLTATGYKFTNKTTPGGPINPGVYDATLAMHRGEGSPTQQQTSIQQQTLPSGGPTRLGIGRKPSTRKPSGVSGRSRSKRKAFSRS